MHIHIKNSIKNMKQIGISKEKRKEITREIIKQMRKQGLI
jgi:DNA-binding transcriptional regulator YhcF (GntR family)